MLPEHGIIHLDIPIILEDTLLRNKISLIFIFLLMLMLMTQCSIPDPDDITPPVVVVIYPYDGSVVSGAINISIESADDDKIEKVWYYFDDERIEESTSSRPTFVFNVASFADEQQHSIVAAARDKEGNVGYSSRVLVTVSKTDDNIPPTVTLVNPLDGQTVGGTVLVVASADDERIVSEVAFFIDGDSVFSDFIYPFQYAWQVSNLPDSSEHTVFAKAFDGSANWSISDAVTVTIFPAIDRTPPDITLLYPVPGDILTGDVNVWVDVTDNVAVDRVEFLIDGVIDNTDRSEPWGFLWDTSPIADNENHTLYIKAYDTSDNFTGHGPFTFVIQ